MNRRDHVNGCCCCCCQANIDITRHFVQNQDGSYDFIEAQALEKRYAAHDGKNLPIRPFELKTYLKVGQCCFTCTCVYLPPSPVVSLILAIAVAPVDLAAAPAAVATCTRTPQSWRHVCSACFSHVVLRSRLDTVTIGMAG